MKNTIKLTFAVAAAIAVILLTMTPMTGQTPAAAPRIPRMPDGKPNLTGLWQALTTANWNILDHNAEPGPYYQLGALFAVPGGAGIVEGNEIPYLPAAATKQRENYLNRYTEDPELKCYMPGIPRANYMPYPFMIVQSQNDIAVAYEYATSNRVINVRTRREPSVDTWMGTSNGRWEKDTLVVEVTGQNGMAWFDRAGNFASENVRVIERFTMAGPDHINYEATIEDKIVFSRPWKISFPLYRRKERNAQMGEFKCVEFTEELIYGHLKKKQ